MPDMSIPYYIFKNNKKLTTFKNFDLLTNRKDNLELTMYHQKSQNNLFLQSFNYEGLKMCKTPNSSSGKKHFSDSIDDE